MTQPPLLGERYRLERVIGRGGMAEVWIAHDLRLNRDVAIKRLRVDLASDPTFQARFHREAKAAAGLSHPNIVAVFDTGEQVESEGGASIPYIVMELVPGHTLRDLLRDGRQIVPAKALEFTQGVLDALAYSHRSGIIHRDIKPANVMITNTGQVKVMDFGIARAVSDTAATMTQTAAVIGTAQYLSPEQARGEKVDTRSDIYSTGCLLYELLTSRPPFQGDSPVSVAYQHVREIPVPPSQVDPELTPEMDAVVLEALAKSPDDRYQTAEAMHADIGRLLAGIPVVAAIPSAAPEPVPTQVAPTPAPARALVVPNTGPQPVYDEEPERERRTGLYVVLALLLVAMLTVGWAAYEFLRRPNTSVAPTTSSTPSITQVKVPTLAGLSEQGARSALSNSQLQVGEVTIVHGADDATKGQVISQTVPPEQLVAAGTKVGFTVNAGPEQGSVPGVTGKTKDEATKLLTAAGFKVAYKDDDPRTEDTKAKPGDVTQQVPDRNTQAQKGDTVTLTIATGKSILPNVVGLDQTKAQADLFKAGFTQVEVVEAESTQQAPGTVLQQDPNTTGAAVLRTQKVTLTLAKAAAVASSAPPPVPPTDSPPPS